MLRGFRVQLSIYHLLLGVWTGAMVMLLLTATASFSFVRQHTLIVGVQGYGEPLKGETATGFIAGGVVGAALSRLMVLQALCAVGVWVCIALQCTRYRRLLDGAITSKRNGARLFLLAVPVGVLLFNVLVVSPGIEETRRAKYDASIPADVAAESEDRFDRYHRLSTRTFGVATLMLMSAMVLSPWCFRSPGDVFKESFDA